MELPSVGSRTTRNAIPELHHRFLNLTPLGRSQRPGPEEESIASTGAYARSNATCRLCRAPAGGGRCRTDG